MMIIERISVIFNIDTDLNPIEYGSSLLTFYICRSVFSKLQKQVHLSISLIVCPVKEINDYEIEII